MSTWSTQNEIFLILPIERLLAITAYGEAGSEGGEGMMAVLNVIRNRTANLAAYGDSEILSITGSSYHAVILKKGQFSMFNIGDPVRSTAERIASNFDTIVAANSTLAMAYNLALMLLNGQLDDNTGGADHYFNPNVVQPTWAASLQLTGQVGNHVFYKEPGSSYPVPVSTILASIIPTTSETSVSTTEAPILAGLGGTTITTLLLIGLVVGLLVEGIRRWR
jgi:hypothetical protein